MIVKCSIIEEITADEDSVPIKVYGLKFYESGNQDHGIRTEKRLFFKREEAETATKRINENDLCDVHIPSIIEDLLL